MRPVARDGRLVFGAGLHSGRASSPLYWPSLQFLSQSLDLCLDRFYPPLCEGNSLRQPLQALFIRLLRLALADAEGEIEQRPKNQCKHIQASAQPAFAEGFRI